MAKSDYVLGTNVKHGEPDGEVINLTAGTKLSDLDVDDDQVAQWWVDGVLARAGSAEDPNTWVSTTAHETTPALVQEVLLAQSRHVEAGLDIPADLLTQPGA